MVVPPALLRSSLSRSASLSLRGMASSPRSCPGSSIIPLKATLSEQLWAVARSYGFPSILGISLHLDVLHASQMGILQGDSGRANKGSHYLDSLDWCTQDPRDALPCITEESWQILFERGMLSTNLLQYTGFPIAGRVEFEIDLMKAHWYDAWANPTPAPAPSGRPPLRLSVSYTGSDRSYYTSRSSNSYYGSPSVCSSGISEEPLSCYFPSVSDNQNAVAYAPRARVRQRSIYLLSQERQYSRLNSLASLSKVKSNLPASHGLLSAHEEDLELPSTIEINVTAVPKEAKENFTASVLDLVEESFRSIAEETDSEVAFNRAQLFVASRQGLSGDSYDQLTSTAPEFQELSHLSQHILSSNKETEDKSNDHIENQCTAYESEYCIELLGPCMNDKDKVQPTGPTTKTFEEMSKSMRRARRNVTVLPQSVARQKKSNHTKTQSLAAYPSLQHSEDRESLGCDEEIFKTLAGMLEELKNSPKQIKSESKVKEGLPKVKSDDDETDHLDIYDFEDSDLSDLELGDFSVIQSAKKVPIERFSGRRTRYIF
ncbi:hypothetical protein DFH28DRAFT_1121008 [Melampsora americana]|nr:hypothetical protein DFH28DRAFT_1121008 [Melampsora americana]